MKGPSMDGLNLKTYEGRLGAFRRIFDPENKIANDVISLRPELVEYGEDDTLIVRFHPQEWQLNGIGYVQGGFLAAFIDVVCGPMAAVYAENRTAGSLDMQMNYLRPVTMKDSEFLVKAQVVNDTRRTTHIRAELIKQNGKVAVTASTTVMKDEPEK